MVSLWRYDWQKGHRKIADATAGLEGLVTFDPSSDTRMGTFLAAPRDEKCPHPGVRGRVERHEALESGRRIRDLPVALLPVVSPERHHRAGRAPSRVGRGGPPPS